MTMDADRYATGAIILHWLIALAILGLLGSGYWMVRAMDEPGLMVIAFQAYQFHKAFGVLILLLTLIRIAWRFLAKTPAPPPGIGPITQRAALVVHGALYALMLAMPLSGWLMVSASPLGLSTSLFGVVDWPHLPIEADAALEKSAKAIHWWAAYLFAALAVAHVAAALKHQFIDRDGLMGRMWFVHRRPASTDRSGRGVKA